MTGKFVSVDNHKGFYFFINYKKSACKVDKQKIAITIFNKKWAITL